MSTFITIDSKSINVNHIVYIEEIEGSTIIYLTTKTMIRTPLSMDTIELKIIASEIRQ